MWSSFICMSRSDSCCSLDNMPRRTSTDWSGVPTIPQVHYSHNDVAVFARFCYWLGGGFRSYFRRIPVLDDLHALVEFAQAGSIAGAADRLFRTPSAITRQPQRLEAELGAELLDRSTKP